MKLPLLISLYLTLTNYIVTMLKLLRLTFLFAIAFTIHLNCFSQNHKHLNDNYVIVLDIQIDSARNIPKSKITTEFIEAINLIIENSKPEEVIYIKAIHRALSISITGFSVDTLPISKLDNRLKIVSSNVFEKSKPDAFSNDELVDFLSSNNTKEIIIVGLMAEECLYATALGGLKLDFDVFIVPEAIIGKTEKGKEKAISKLKKKGVKVVPLSDIIGTSQQQN